VKVGAFETMQYWCLGSNYFGQLGLETSNGDYNTQVYIPVAFGRGDALASMLELLSTVSYACCKITAGFQYVTNMNFDFRSPSHHLLRARIPRPNNPISHFLVI
jgi:hypothetical protein